MTTFLLPLQPSLSADIVLLPPARPPNDHVCETAFASTSYTTNLQTVASALSRILNVALKKFFWTVELSHFTDRDLLPTFIALPRNTGRPAAFFDSFLALSEFAHRTTLLTFRVDEKFVRSPSELELA